MKHGLLGLTIAFLIFGNAISNPALARNDETRQKIEALKAKYAARKQMLPRIKTAPKVPTETSLPTTSTISKKTTVFQASSNYSNPNYLGVGGSHWISKNVDSGEFIVLEDGSLWKIDPLDKVDACLWLSISDIKVVESDDGSPGYEYLLINTDDDETAHAKFLGYE